MIKKPGWWFSAFVTFACGHAFGQETLQQSDVANYFVRGKYEIRADTAVMFSPVGADKGRPTVNYTLSGVQCGWMLTDVNPSCWLPGNLELAAGAIGGTVFEGRGSYLAGGTAWIRYNIVEPNWRFVPYIQGGLGAEATDFDPSLIGERFNFNLNVGVGTRWFVAKDWSINFECLYQHISNAKISHTDVGINAVGPMVGVSYFF